MKDPFIQLRGISVAFGSHSVFGNVSFEIRKGERVAIAGESGAGKSVLLKILTGLMKPDMGEYFLDGQDTSRFKESDWNAARNKFGFVFQSAALFDSMTVAENIGLKLSEEGNFNEGEIRVKTVESLMKVGLTEETGRKLPAELSGGMRKRVAIARAIIHDPDCILYDEPTTGLDPRNSALIDTLMNDLSASSHRISLIVTHDLHTLRNCCDRILFLSGGKLLFDGSREDFLRSDQKEIREFLQR